MLRSIRTIRNIPRLKTITLVLARHGLHQVASLLGAPIRFQLRRFWSRPLAEPLRQVERLRLAFQELGPTFIKLGQFIANRPDLFPESYVREFQKLENRVTPVPFAKMRSVLVEELGEDLDRSFSRIDEEPLASASIAQIHRATTRSGEEVVLKIQKPGTGALIESDLEILSLLAEALSRGDELRILDPEGVVAEARRVLERELNFTFERHAQERVRASFAEDPVLVVPKTHPELSGRRVLVMEYLPGTSLRDSVIDGDDARRVARQCTRILFDMIFRDGYFHADPHSSNILLLPGQRLGWVDFGAMGLFTAELRDRLVSLLRAIVARDYKDAARHVLRLGSGGGDAPLFEFSQDLASRLDAFFGLTLEEIDIGSLFKAVMELARDHRIVIAPGFIIMTRCLLLMQGVATRIDPSFNTMAEVEPLLRRHLVDRLRPDRIAKNATGKLGEMAAALWETPIHLGEILRRLAQGRFQIDTHLQGLERLTRRFEACTDHIVQALIVSALLVSSSLVMHLELAPRVWGMPVIGLVGYLGAGLLSVWILLSRLGR